MFSSSSLSIRHSPLPSLCVVVLNFRLLLLLLLLLVVTTWTTICTAQYPPAAGSGGARCTANYECGIPAANCATTRNDCQSLSGTCSTSSGVCACDGPQFGCGNCAGRSVLVRNASDPTSFYYTTVKPMLDGSGKSIDVCSVPRGGGTCTADNQCRGAGGGLCLGGHCVCTEDYLCGDCSMGVTDLLYGLKCGTPVGGGACSGDSECNRGKCVGGVCVCNPLMGCATCTADVRALANGTAKCAKLGFF